MSRFGPVRLVVVRMLRRTLVVVVSGVVALRAAVVFVRDDSEDRRDGRHRARAVRTQERLLLEQVLKRMRRRIAAIFIVVGTPVSRKV